MKDKKQCLNKGNEKNQAMALKFLIAQMRINIAERMNEFDILC